MTVKSKETLMDFRTRGKPSSRRVEALIHRTKESSGRASRSTSTVTVKEKSNGLALAPRAVGVQWRTLRIPSLARVVPVWYPTPVRFVPGPSIRGLLGCTGGNLQPIVVRLHKRQGITTPTDTSQRDAHFISFFFLISCFGVLSTARREMMQGTSPSASKGESKYEENVL